MAGGGNKTTDAAGAYGKKMHNSHSQKYGEFTL